LEIAMSLLAVGHVGAPHSSLLHVGIIAHNEILAHGIQALLGAAPGISGRIAAGAAPGLPQERFDIVVLACDGFPTREVQRIAASVAQSGAKLVLVIRTTREDLVGFLGSVRSNGVVVQEELTADLLSSALRHVDRGETYVATSLAGVLVANIRSAAAVPQKSAVMLTARERQVLDLLAEGLSNKLIAQRVYLSSHGVKKVVAGLLAKFDCPNRTQLVALALRNGLITPAELALS
jgi:DNA-binding NarL/FixJ family response regulator